MNITSRLRSFENRIRDLKDTSIDKELDIIDIVELSTIHAEIGILLSVLDAENRINKIKEGCK